MRKKPRIYMQRESVAMGDDMVSHDEEWIIQPEYDLLHVLNLCQREYLPTNIQGVNPGWKVLWKNKLIATIWQKSDVAKIIDPDLTLDKIKDGNGEITLFFEYIKD